MKNKNVGYLIVGISIVIGMIILIFNFGINNIIEASCSHGPSCTMYDALAMQTWLSIAIAGIILVIGLFFVFAKEEGIEKTDKKINYSDLGKEEKKLIKIIEEAEGTIFQSDLVEKSEFSKVKVSRLLDRMEGRGLIERKRRGMTNVVVLK